MAADGGREARPVAEQLFDPREGRLFDFFQAVTLLEALARRVDAATASVGDGADPAREAVRFAANVRLHFPAADVAALAPASPATGGRPSMTVNFMGLAGALGPLPGPFAELLVRRTHLGDTAARDFLDIFHHRLISLAFRIRKRHRVGLGVASPVEDAAAHYLFALIGLGVPALRGRLAPVPDRALLFYAGALSREVRPLGGLVGMLRCHFGLPVDAEPLVGAYFPIDPSHRTTIGPSGKNRRIGDAVLGSRYWDPAACIEIRVGPLDVDDYLRLLPGTGKEPPGDRLDVLLTLARFYAGEAIDIRVRLLLHPAAARPSAPKRTRVQRLGERPRLGYTAWVGRAFEQRDVLLQGAALRRAAAGR
jgi:type VI secretion system protein ImpH